MIKLGNNSVGRFYIRPLTTSSGSTPPIPGNSIDGGVSSSSFSNTPLDGGQANSTYTNTPIDGGHA